MRRLSARITLLAGTLLVGLLALEIAVRATSFRAADRAALGRGDAASTPTADGPALRNRVHPFLGWTRRPGSQSPIFFRPGGLPIAPEGGFDDWVRENGRTNPYGYFSAVSDYAAIPAEHYVVGIFGGSVADQLALLGGEALRDALAEALGMTAERVTVLNVASAGYKQPQQLISLLQMLLLGVEFDLVVNLDGFNEVVFGASDAGAGRHPVFPSHRHWALTVSLASALPSDEQLERAGRIAGLRRRARAVEETVVGRALVGRSELARAAAVALSGYYRGQAETLELELQELPPAAASPIVSLPHECLDRRDGCWQLIGELWKRASLLMRDVAEGEGAQYLHLLQPTYHLEGSKPVSPEEARNARANTLERELVGQGYPRLRQLGKALRARGVRFHDLTQVFEDHPETLYVDGCCHFNVRGNAILAEAIASLVAEDPAPPERP